MVDLENEALPQLDLFTQEEIVGVVIDHLTTNGLDLEGRLFVQPCLIEAATFLKVGVLTDPEKRDHCVVFQHHPEGLQVTTYRVDKFGEVYTVQVSFNGCIISDCATYRYKTALGEGSFHAIQTPIAALGTQFFSES